MNMQRTNIFHSAPRIATRGRQRLKRVGIALLCVLALSLLGSPAQAQGDRAAARPEAAAGAWARLRAAAEQKMQQADDPAGVVDEVRADLKRFAHDHAGTPEAVLARHVRAMV